jgi:hypothetical protein
MRPRIGRHRDDVSMIVKAIRKAARHYKKMEEATMSQKQLHILRKEHEE